MALRVTEGEVKALMRTGLQESEITPHLKAASSVVDNALAGQGYSANELSQIELWLAAHFVSCTDPAVSREKIGESDVQYHGKTDMGLDFTPYGQQVKMLDYKGKLAAIANQKGQAEMKVIG
jgi:hypothetical protein